MLSSIIAVPSYVSAETEYNFAKALQLSLYFFDANKCGEGITGGRLEWRGDCHVEDKEVPLVPMTKDYFGTNMSQEYIDKYRDIFDPDGDGTVNLSPYRADFFNPHIHMLSMNKWDIQVRALTPLNILSFS